jgi:hypothetical protein
VIELHKIGMCLSGLPAARIFELEKTGRRYWANPGEKRERGRKQARMNIEWCCRRGMVVVKGGRLGGTGPSMTWSRVRL